MTAKEKLNTKTKTKPKSKSDVFRELHKQGHSIAEIAKATGDYYSFVHRVIKREEKGGGQTQ